MYCKQATSAPQTGKELLTHLSPEFFFIDR